MGPFNFIGLAGGGGAAANAVRFVLYEEASGRIVQSGFCAPFDLHHQGGVGLSRLDGVAADLTKEYVVGGWVIPRPVLSGFDRTNIIAGGVDAARMNVPPGCLVKIDGVEHIVDDGEIVLASAAPGVWRIDIDHWPYMPFTAEITCALI
jgi:hypothetical protein